MKKMKDSSTLFKPEQLREHRFLIGKMTRIFDKFERDATSWKIEYSPNQTIRFVRLSSSSSSLHSSELFWTEEK